MQLRRQAPALLAIAAVVLVAAYIGIQIANHRSSNPRPRDTTPRSRAESIHFKRIFGCAGARTPTSAARPFDEIDLEPAHGIEVPSGVALLTTGEGDEIFLRGPALVRAHREGARRLLFVDRGEALVSVGDSDWHLCCSHGIVRARESEVGLSTGGRIAVVRGPVTAVAGKLEVQVEPGEVAQLHGDRVSGSLLEEGADIVAWARTALAERAVPVTDGNATVQPDSRYLFRGIASAGPVSVKAGDRTLASWPDLPSRFSVELAVPAGATQVRIAGPVSEAVLVRIGPD